MMMIMMIMTIHNEPLTERFHIDSKVHCERAHPFKTFELARDRRNTAKTM